MKGVAPAKVNLYLEVKGRRPDGYHEISTLFQTVRFGDEVEVEATEALGIVCEVQGADLPTDRRNLAVRAAEAYLEATRGRSGVRIRLSKRIPVGGGLGGGSSDAAAVLRLLEDEHGALGLGGLLDLASRLGSDVPFLVRGGTALGTGRGEVLETLPPAPKVAVVLVMPPIATDTAHVYSRFAPPLRRAPPRGPTAAAEALASGDPARIRAAHHNDLAETVLRSYPEMLRFTSLVERLLGRPPCMTGSGSTLFDVPDAGEMDAVLARLRGLSARVEATTT